MEGYVNTWQRNSGESSLKDNVALSSLQPLSLVEARSNDVRKHLLDFVNRELFGKLGDVHFLNLQVVQDVGQCLQSD